MRHDSNAAAGLLAALAVLIGVTFGSGCRSDGDDPPDPPAAGEAALEDDATVLATAVRHFATQKIEAAFNGRESRTVILIHQEFIGSRLDPSADQLRQDTKREGWEVPAEAGESLRQRNATTAPVRGLRFGGGLLVADLDAGPMKRRPDPLKDHPEAKAYAYLYRPGYTRDGRTAVVRFLFGPTAHGASATYLLTRGDGGWVVQKWAFAYYA